MNAPLKTAGMIALVAFALMAGSVICFASGQASVMSDCGGSMAPAGMCPFMSVSVPVITNAVFAIRTLGLVVVLFFAARLLLRHSIADDYAKKFFIIARERKRNPVIGRRADAVLNLISDGILHSRVFGF